MHTLIALKEDLKAIVKSSSIDYVTRQHLFARYKRLRAVIYDCLNLLKSPLEESILGNLFTLELEQESLDNNNCKDSTEGSETEFEEEFENMATKLDLSLGLKVIQPFDGTVAKLTSYIEGVELFQDYSEGVPEDKIIKFLKTTLVGSAHGAIDGSVTVADALQALKNKFAIRVTPRAVQNEMSALKQSQKSISDFGSEMEKLSAKLAAAHVSMGTFAHEAAAVNIVEPIAVQSFIDGLKDPSTKFFLKARNPTTLNKAISDALECQATPSTDNMNENMMALWCTSNQRPYYYARGRRGYGGNRGYQNTRGRSYGRGRGNYSNYNNPRNDNMNSQPQSHNYGRGHRGNRPPRANHNGNDHRAHTANIAEQAPEQPRQRQPVNQEQNQAEEANLIDFFR